MGSISPPSPISRDEFRRRYAEGARTTQELDPVFWAWLEQSRRMHLVQAAILGGGAVMLLVMLLVLALVAR